MISEEFLPVLAFAIWFLIGSPASSRVKRSSFLPCGEAYTNASDGLMLFRPFLERTRYSG